MVIKLVVWTDFAKEQLKNIYLYYKSEANISTAKRIKSGILYATRHLKRHPMCGAIEYNLESLHVGHRYLVEGHYKIVYYIDGNIIYITDVFDCRQNPKKMKG